jgi:predicted XRE-type DNA-binding protein
MGGVRNISSDLHRAQARGGVRSTRVSEKVATDKSKRLRAGAKKTSKPLVTSGFPGDPDYEEFDSIWESLGIPPLEAANLDARANLMIQLREIIRKEGWTQARTAKECGVSQPRINDLMRGRIDKFSIDA